jgi:anti-sigma factor RsiW
MNCERCEEMLAAYAAGDLESAEASAVERHLGECHACREALEAYQGMIARLADEPMLSPTTLESERLAEVLEHVPVCRPVRRPVNVRSFKEFLGFSVATAVVFALMLTVLALQALGQIDILALIALMGLPRLVITVTAIVFVTSFIPIWMTARRRLLNGLTFSR